MKNHLWIYQLILLVAGLYYTVGCTIPDKRDDQTSTQVQIPASEEGIQVASSSAGSADDSHVEFYDQKPDKQRLIFDLAPPKTRSMRPCQAPNFKPKSVAISIQFEFNSYTLTKEAQEFADLLGEALSADELRDCDFEIEGHTDILGEEEYNQTLSEKRAKAVKDHLVNIHSINPARLKVIGYGEKSLLSRFSPNSPKQRRVQVKNVGSFQR